MKEYNKQRFEFQQLEDDGTLEYLYNKEAIIAFKPIALTTDE